MTGIQKLLIVSKFQFKNSKLINVQRSSIVKNNINDFKKLGEFNFLLLLLIFLEDSKQILKR